MFHTQPDRPFGRGVQRGFAISLGAHLALLGAFYLGMRLEGRWRPPPQAVLTAKLVQLGKPRAPNLLPRRQTQTQAKPAPSLPPKPPAAKPSVPVPTPQVAVTPAPQAASPKLASPAAAPPTPAQVRARAADLGRVGQALERLKHDLDGQADGRLQGETDLAQAGDQFATEVKNCLQRNYVIEGVDKTRVQGLSALVIVRIQADGKIIDFKLTRKSGVSAFDDAVARAVRRCDKTAAPPALWRQVVRREGIEIDFQP